MRLSPNARGVEMAPGDARAIEDVQAVLRKLARIERDAALSPAEKLTAKQQVIEQENRRLADRGDGIGAAATISISNHVTKGHI